MKNLTILCIANFICCITPNYLKANDTKTNTSSEEKSILATTKIQSTVYVFYQNGIKIYDDNMVNKGVMKNPEDLFGWSEKSNFDVNAAVFFGKDKLYLIDGDSATAYTIPEGKEGYFRKDSAQSGSLQEVFRLPNDWFYLDAAIRLNESKVLFIKGHQMICYDTDLMKPGKPMKISKSMLSGAVGNAKVEAGYLDKSLKTVLILTEK